MALVVQKFGGTSVGSIDRIRNVARRALATHRGGHRVVLIVSAMSGETNRLLALAHQVANVPDAREMDVIAATGEQVSASLTALAIQAEGGSARSLLGHQVKIVTTDAFTKARIKTIESQTIFDSLDQGNIAVVAGFQGVDDRAADALDEDGPPLRIPVGAWAEAVLAARVATPEGTPFRIAPLEW